MLMKWRKLLPLFALGGLLLGVAGFAMPGTAHAANEKYVFGGPTKKDSIDNLSKVFQDKQTNTSALDATKVFARDGVWPDKGISLNYSQSATDNYNSGGSICVGKAGCHPAERSGSAKRYVYSQTYSCSLAGKVVQQSVIEGWTIEALVILDLGPNYNTKNHDYSVSYGEVRKTEGSKTSSPDADSIPAGCKLSTVSSRMGNYNSLSPAQKKDWNVAVDAKTLDEVNTTPATDGGDSGDNCSGVFGWAICPMLNGAEGAVKWIEENFIAPFYHTDPLRLDCGSISAGARASTEGCAEYNVWVAIRNLSNIFFVLIFLAFIFANTLSFNLDSYAVKKMLPKLIAAVIIVQFSYLFMAFAIDVTNVLGQGIGGIIDAAVPKGTNINVGADQAGAVLGVSVAVGAAAAVGVATAISSGAIWVVVAVAFLAMLGVFFTLIFRQILIVMLVISAPIAIACMVLPNTEKVYKMWLNTLIKVLLMYPLIMLIFGSSKLLSLAAGINGGAFASVIRLVVIVIPLFLIPFTFKWAGGIMNTGASFIQKRAAGYGKKVNDSDWAKERRTQAGIDKRSLAAGTGISVMGQNLGAGRAGRFLGRATTLDRGGVRAQSKLNTDRGVFDKQFEAGNHSADDLEMLLGGRDELKRRKDAAGAAFAAIQAPTDTDKLKYGQALNAADASYQKTKGLQGNKVAMQAAALRIADMGLVSERTRKTLTTAMPGPAGQALWGEMGRKAGDKQLHLQAVNFNTGAVEISKLKSKVDGKDAKKLAGQGSDFWRTVQTAEGTGGAGSVLDQNIRTQLSAPGKLSAEAADILAGTAANSDHWGGEASNPTINVVP